MALLLLHLPTLALNATATLIYPLYSSYKAVTNPHTPLAEMEVWLVYWSVFACFSLFESVFGFVWSWIPFYYEIRLVFNVWLVAPQTRGATYMYTNHLHPFLEGNQQQIDGYIEEGKRRARGKVDAILGGVWSSSLGLGADSAGGSAGPTVPGKEPRHRPPTNNAPAPPTQHNPAQAPLGMVGNLMKTYAPVAIASARTFLESKAPPPHSTAAYSIPASSSPLPADRKREEALVRRKQLESQLAALDAIPSSTSSESLSSDDTPVPVTMINPKKRSPRGSFGGDAKGSLRSRIVSAGSARTAKAAMGESYDLLDQNDLGPVNKRGWLPWSPGSGS